MSWGLRVVVVFVLFQWHCMFSLYINILYLCMFYFLRSSSLFAFWSCQSLSWVADQNRTLCFSIFTYLYCSARKLFLIISLISKWISEDSVLVQYWMLRNPPLQSHLQVRNRTLWCNIASLLYCQVIVLSLSGPAPAPGPGPSPSSSLTPGPSLYTVGEEVLALWKQNRKYPATILRIQDDGCYLVRFYDGFEKTVRGQCIRRVGRAGNNKQF